MTEPDSSHPPAMHDHGEYRLLPADFADIDQLICFCWRAVEKGVFRYGHGRESGSIQLALREAICNAFCHGNRQDRRAPIFFAWRFSGPELVCTVRDAGPGFDYQHPPDPTRPENLCREHGRGLFIIHTLAHRVSWQQDGRELIMVFSRERREGED